ncbi:MULTISPECIES: hypothetical protein [Nocardia]|uniref:DUF8176 domain-containing protein n=1 Tax=Nocardia speluncae TaxID=419477 RepID=A0A846XHD2_9NOCA|nr:MULTISPECIES: hypothetical protein [Nocardia]MBF6456062.1 hypothetical protein [Nocardia cyriacigeorgica]MBF6478039.1 hypothetical protein [Nocardia cyriacigeorgica]MBF6553198.1 hypothetical protein [Nocardia cyriacigeorgica]NKY34887.1 hypothetical protein [Nocardia speluncae]
MATYEHRRSGDDRQIVLDAPAATALAQWLAESSESPNPEAEERWPRPQRRAHAPVTIRAVSGGALVAALTATAMALTTALAGTDHADSAVDPPMSITAAPPPWPGDGRDRSPTVTGSSAAACGPGTLEAATVVSGPRPRRAATGAQAIAVFEAAYYHARDGLMARDVVATEAAVSDAATIQAGIDSAPPVTAYCTRIEPLTPGLYAVQITETRPDTPPRVWRQRISTAHHDGHSVITAIASE